jgi:ATP-dependent DNA helicase RecQ
LFALGFAPCDHAAHGALKLASASRPVLKGEQRVEMRRLRERPAPRRKEKYAGPPTCRPADLSLLDSLKSWRTRRPRAQGVPAYVILHDSTLARSRGAGRGTWTGSPPSAA